MASHLVNIIQPLPLFTVVLPTHNRAPLLCRAITSVLRQTYHDYELIIVDDASTDATAEAVSAFNDPRLRYIRLESNGGASAARNVGIRAARGQCVTFLDDDDEFLPDFLAEMYRHWLGAPPSVGFAWCGVRRVRLTNEGLIVLREQTWTPISDASENLNTKYVHLTVGTGFGLTVRTECFQQIGLFDESLCAAVDTDLLFRLGAQYEHTVVPHILVNVYQHEGDRLTAANPRRAEALEQVIRNNLALIGQDDDLWDGWHRGSASLHYRVGNRQRGRTMMIRALARKPLRWRSWKSFACYELFGHEQLGLRQALRRVLPRSG